MGKFHKYFSTLVLLLLGSLSGCAVLFNNSVFVPGPIKGGVFGQTSFTTLQQGKGLFSPTQAIRIGQKLAVSDLYNRVLIWNSFPSSSTILPDVILGQSDFTNTIANNGGVSAATLSRPNGIASDGTHFVVGDQANHRVLIWNSIPTRTQQPADLVLGQIDFTSSASACSATGMFNPRGVLY